MTAPIVELIGDTPLIRLKAASDATGCEIFGKAEFLNPGGSVKDRTALGLIRAAEADGSLTPGGVIVEGTAGNTGIGLALVAGALGYKALTKRRQARSPHRSWRADYRSRSCALFQRTPFRPRLAPDR